MGKKKRCLREEAAHPAPVDPGVAAWRSALIGLRREAGILVDQQFWCFGCDLRGADNLLLRYGFERHRYDDQRLCSAYTRPLDTPTPSAMTWTIWGWGALVSTANGTGLLLQRFGFQPVIVPPLDAPHDLVPGSKLRPPTTAAACARAAQQLHALCDALHRYEAWIAAEMPPGYRQTTIDRWDKLRRGGLAADVMPARWAALADRSMSLVTHSVSLTIGDQPVMATAAP